MKASSHKITLGVFQLLFLCMPLQIAAQHHLSEYKIFDIRKGREISLRQLNKELKNVDVVLFGEDHNDSIAHVLELNLLGLMLNKYKNVGLSMEMFQSDAQLVLNEYLNGLVTESNLMKDAKLWNNYKDYSPIVELAKEKKIPVLAANAPSRYTNRVTRNGLESLSLLSEEAKLLLAPIPIDTLTGRYYEKFSELLGDHQSQGEMKIYQSQNLWDATMAYRISVFMNKKHLKVLHLNGRFHSDEKLGVYQQLKQYAPHLTLKNISCFPHEDLQSVSWQEFKDFGDFIILTKEPDNQK